ncbi:DUF2852 domain-containing protein [Chelatococcus sp. GCM10030263]|uniref:DUF2852 domain-containing protein n=1 Tax=Chelatococcus sp. GCM10030263 TaxID=3273387 RepID=UPI003608D1A2
MQLAAKLDEFGKPAWIALMVLGFVLFWPLGLAILIYSFWSGRMACGSRRGFGRWQMMEDGRGWGGRGGWGGRWGGPPSSGNRAFDEYREETLRRLEEEQREFREFLERLRLAKDKAEFDQFMADRRNRPPATPDQPEANG